MDEDTFKGTIHWGFLAAKCSQVEGFFHIFFFNLYIVCNNFLLLLSK